jgi:uncharacterized membrane protein
LRSARSVELRRLLPRGWEQSLRERERSPLWDLLPRGVTREGVVLGHHLREGRFQRSLALIAAGSAVLAGLEVSYEHYRGSYSQRKMYLPVALTPPLVAAGIWCVFSRRAARVVLPGIALLHVGTGVLGFVYHLRGIARKPGGFSLPVNNIVMGPPPFAPLLFAVPGYLAFIASFLRREDDPRGRFLPLRKGPVWRGLIPGLPLRRDRRLRRELREGRFQQHMAFASAAAGLFSALEALYSHYKNRFRYFAEWTPLLCGGLLAAAGAATVIDGRAARKLLPAASALAIADGGLGFWYHGRGILRRPGGTKHLLYNIMYGPPIFAPLLLGAAGFLGVLASLLRREQ